MDAGGPEDLHMTELLTDLGELSDGLAGYFLEGAIVSLEKARHESGVALSVAGSYSLTYKLQWNSPEKRVFSSWDDPGYATENGAYGIVLLVLSRVAGLVVVRRSQKRTGFDFWMARRGEEQPLFQNLVRLEVSGTQMTATSRTTQRLAQKAKQTSQSDSFGLSAIVAIVQFSLPGVLIGTRDAKS
jgi:hypothetical protein